MFKGPPTQALGLMAQMGRKLWSVHWPTILFVAFLSSIGALVLYSVSGGSLSPWASNHIIRFMAGLGVMFCLVLVPRRALYYASAPFYILSILLLVLVLFFGIERNGSQRWLSFGGGVFQPSEFVKITLVMVLASYYQWLPFKKVSKLWALIPPLVLIALPMMFVLKQPDLGTSLIYAFIGGGMMFMAGVSIYYFLFAGASLAGVMPFIWSHLKPYQKERVTVFLNPDQDPLGAGYHILQSKIAFGAGGLHGKGFMGGTQSQLDFLPEKHTDFIFTMIGEEMGFVGTISLVVLYVILLLLFLSIARGIKDRFGRMLVTGFFLTLFFYTVINMAMVTGLMPVVGVPLPFISYGGTAMMSLMFGLGLSMNAYVNRAKKRRPT